MLTALVGYDAQLLTVGSHVIKAGGDAGSTNINLGGGSGYGDGMSSVEPLGLDFDAFLGKEALIHSDKKGCAAG